MGLSPCNHIPHSDRSTMDTSPPPSTPCVTSSQCRNNLTSAGRIPDPPPPVVHPSMMRSYSFVNQSRRSFDTQHFEASFLVSVKSFLIGLKHSTSRCRSMAMVHRPWCAYLSFCPLHTRGLGCCTGMRISVCGNCTSASASAELSAGCGIFAKETLELVYSSEHGTNWMPF